MKRLKKLTTILLALLFLFPFLIGKYTGQSSSPKGYQKVYVNPYKLPASFGHSYVLCGNNNINVDSSRTALFCKAESYSQVVPNANFINGFPIMLIKQ